MCTHQYCSSFTHSPTDREAPKEAVIAVKEEVEVEQVELTPRRKAKRAAKPHKPKSEAQDITSVEYPTQLTKSTVSSSLSLTQEYSSKEIPTKKLISSNGIMVFG